MHHHPPAHAAAYRLVGYGKQVLRRRAVDMLVFLSNASQILVRCSTSSLSSVCYHREWHFAASLRRVRLSSL